MLRNASARITNLRNLVPISSFFDAVNFKISPHIADERAFLMIYNW